MVAIPKPEVSVADMIYAAIEKENNNDLYLTRIGASGIGEECLRSIWFSWRGFATSKFGGRMLRLFETGHIQEDRVIADLRRAGFGVWSHDDNGKQFTYTDETGHFVVKLDGVIKGIPGAEKTPHALEVKSHNKKSFTELEKKGVLVAKPMHYAQMQAGMMFGGFTRAFYIAICKDDESYYVERIREDLEVQKELKLKINKLVEAKLTPSGISEDGGAFPCKWCDMRGVCTGEQDILKTCRSCAFSEPLKEGGQWLCSLENKTLSSDEQVRGCDEYRPWGS